MAKAKEQPAQGDTCLLEIPVGEASPNSYKPRHVDLGEMTADQATALQKVKSGLESAGATLKNGRKVRGSTDALRFILEKIATELA